MHICNRWIHKRCSGVRDNLSLVGDGFRYNRCEEADLADDLVMDGDTYGSVKSVLIYGRGSFCYH